MFSIWRIVLQTAVIALLTASVALTQPSRPANEATEFFKKYSPTHQFADAVRKVGVGGNGGGGGGGSPADKKYCDGMFTATPKQAEQMIRRLYAGVWETAERAGAKLDGPKELPQKESQTAFRLSYAQGDCIGEVAVTMKQGEAGPARGSFHYAISITIVESKRKDKKPKGE